MILVPKVFHRIWLGPGPMPEEFERYERTWWRFHPGWDIQLWEPQHLVGLFPPERAHLAELAARCEKPSNASNIYRYEIMYRFGGVYLDTDFECRKNIEPLIDNEELFTAHQVDDRRNPGYLAPGFFGCTPKHAAMKDLLDAVPTWNGPTYGPTLFTHVLPRWMPTVLPKRYFYPYSWDELHRKDERFPEAYAVHHWGSRTQPFVGKRVIRF